MSEENKFWRLLGEYERLTQNETTALRECNFPAIRDIQAKKQEFLSELVKIGPQCGLDGSHPEVKSRMALLSEAGRRNAAFVSDFLAKRRSELESINGVFGRVRSLRTAYKHGMHRKSGKNLLAQG